MAAAFWSGLRDQTDEFFVGAERAVAGGARLWRLGLPSTAPEGTVRCISHVQAGITSIEEMELSFR